MKNKLIVSLLMLLVSTVQSYQQLFKGLGAYARVGIRSLPHSEGLAAQMARRSQKAAQKKVVSGDSVKPVNTQIVVRDTRTTLMSVNKNEIIPFEHRLKDSLPWLNRVFVTTQVVDAKIISNEFLVDNDSTSFDLKVPVQDLFKKEKEWAEYHALSNIQSNAYVDEEIIEKHKEEYEKLQSRLKEIKHNHRQRLSRETTVRDLLDACGINVYYPADSDARKDIRYEGDKYSLAFCLLWLLHAKEQKAAIMKYVPKLSKHSPYYNGVTDFYGVNQELEYLDAVIALREFCISEYKIDASQVIAPDEFKRLYHQMLRAHRESKTYELQERLKNWSKKN